MNVTPDCVANKQTPLLLHTLAPLVKTLITKMVNFPPSMDLRGSLHVTSCSHDLTTTAHHESDESSPHPHKPIV
jgi:hypothetical protein